MLYEDPTIHERRWFLLGVMCLSLVLVVASVSGLNVALPSLQSDLQATATELQWIIDAYALVFAGCLLTAGALGDRFGRKRALLAGLVVFAAGALVAGLATEAPQVIAGRAVTGLGAAFVMPATLSIITTVFPPLERRRAIAMWAGFAGAGAALGPLVSGALLEFFWWGSALLVNVPLVAGIVVAVVMFAPESRDPDATPLDPVGAGLSLVGLTALVFGIIEGPDRGWSDSIVLVAFAVAAVCLLAFVMWEHRTRHPMLPMWLFRDRRFSVGAGVITVTFFVMLGFFYLSTQYLQFVRGYSPFEAGAAMLPLALTMLIVSPRSAVLAERLGSGRVISLGFLAVAAGCLVISTMSPTTPYLVWAAALVLLATGMGLTMAPSTGSIMSAVPMAKAGVGSAVNDTTREVGGALGIAVLGSIINAGYRSRIDLTGIPLPPQAKAAAEESVGAATAIARQIPGGDELAHRAGEAFTSAFHVANLTSVALLVAGAAVVAVVFNRRAEEAATQQFEEQHPPIASNP
jgi:EmrB/QacA subfamily drug resistance transporter